MKYPVSKELPPLPNSVIDSSGLHDYPSNCVTNTQQEQPSSEYHWTGATKNKAPVTLMADQWVKSLLSPFQLWLAKVPVSRRAVQQFNITLIEGGGSLAVFGRRMEHPSVTKHDWVEYIHSESRRYSSDARSVSAELTQGTWYIGLYNDGDTELEFGLVSSYYTSGAECLNNCAGHGRCVGGKCQCDAQWSGEDCSTSLCPVLCSGHGHYGGGQCHCEAGWKGEECNVRHDECEVPDCNRHGECTAGVCQCQHGWTGQFCEKREYFVTPLPFVCTFILIVAPATALLLFLKCSSSEF